MYAREPQHVPAPLVKDGNSQLELERRDHSRHAADARRRGRERPRAGILRDCRRWRRNQGADAMKLDLITSLYVFMLAGFIGFEVIRRVSPLLHTPLMSLTNALDAIAVVGRDHPGRRRQEHAGDGARHDCDRRRHEQRRGRIPDHRPDAQDVQGERPEETMTANDRQRTRHRNRVPGRHGPVHPLAEMDELAEHGPARRPGRRAGDAAGDRRDAASTTRSSITAGSPSPWCWARSSACRSARCR